MNNTEVSVGIPTVVLSLLQKEGNLKTILVFFALSFLVRAVLWAFGRSKELLNEHDSIRKVLMEDNETLREKIKETTQEVESLRRLLYDISLLVVQLKRQIIELGGTPPTEDPFRSLAEREHDKEPQDGRDDKPKKGNR